MIFDTHAHYDDERFDGDRDEVLTSLRSHNVGLVMNAGCSLKSSIASVGLTQKYDFIYASVGVHPHSADEFTKEQLYNLGQLTEEKKVVAIGEIGLDYHYDFSPRDVQKEVFEQQLILAKELDMPVVIHSREASGDTFELVKKYRPKGVVHCFSGSVELAQEYTKMGMYIGFTGVVTFSNAKKPLEVATMVPQHLLVLETDCPYLAPVPQRGKRCDSTMLEYTAAAIAKARGITPQQLIEAAFQNGKELYNIAL